MPTRKSAGKPKAHIPTDDTRILVDFIRSTGVPIDAIARKLKIGIPTLERLYAEELASAGSLSKAKVVANALSIALDRSHPKHAEMTMFICKTQYHWRETNRSENVIMNQDGTSPDLRTVVILPANGREIPIESLPPPAQITLTGKPRKDVH